MRGLLLSIWNDAGTEDAYMLDPKWDIGVDYKLKF
jgi:hypothetical protein